MRTPHAKEERKIEDYCYKVTCFKTAIMNLQKGNSFYYFNLLCSSYKHTRTYDDLCRELYCCCCRASSLIVLRPTKTRGHRIHVQKKMLRFWKISNLHKLALNNFGCNPGLYFSRNAGILCGKAKNYSSIYLF